jgi:hypothetical protein
VTERKLSSTSLYTWLSFEERSGKKINSIALIGGGGMMWLRSGAGGSLY